MNNELLIKNLKSNNSEFKSNNEEKQTIEEMAEILKAYTKKNNIMASHVILECYAEELYSKNYRKQSEGELTKAHIEAHYEAICALADMVGQFGYSTTFRKQKAICDGGLSALEYAFGALQDCGCKINSNGSITLKNLWAFQEEFEAKMKGGAE